MAVKEKEKEIKDKESPWEFPHHCLFSSLFYNWRGKNGGMESGFIFLSVYFLFP